MAHLNHQFEILPTPGWGGWCWWMRPWLDNLTFLPIDIWRFPAPVRYAALTDPPLSPSDWDVAIISWVDELEILADSNSKIPLIFQANCDPNDEALEIFRKYSHRLRKAVFTSSERRRKWEWENEARGITLQPAIDCSDYTCNPSWNGEIAKILVLGNAYHTRENGRAMEQLASIVGDLPYFLCDPVLLNPERDCNFDRMKSYMKDYRVHLHALTDAGTMGLMETMASGMPAVIFRGYTDGIFENGFEDGVNCFISDDKKYLNQRLVELLADRELGEKIGKAGQNLIKQKYDLIPWLNVWNEILDGLNE